MRRLRWIALVGLAALGLAGWWGLQNHSVAQTEGGGRAAKPGAGPARVVPVEVARAEKKPMPVEIVTIGRVQTIAAVAVKSRIDGVIATVSVRDGQEVKAGDVLFTLDDRALQAAVKQAEAAIARDKAQLENARREVERQLPLSQKEYVTRAQMDQTRTNAVALEGTVRADEAMLEMARVQLSYTVIRAPIDGRLGTISLKVGNQVRVSDTTPLVNLNQIGPIYVSMSVPQANFTALQKALAAGPVPTRATVPGDAGEPLEGKLSYIENAIDTATNTLTVKATFANADRRLWPGQFVNTTIVLAVEPDAIAVPAEAVQAGQNGNYLYVVKDGQDAGPKVVEMRQVEVNRTIEHQAVIAKGVAAGDVVVVNGQLRLDDGMAVTVKPPGSTGGAPPGKPDANDASPAKAAS